MPPANQLPASDQPFPLPTERQKSSIPRAGTPDNWQYPSQQMFYNALRRKGWEFGPEDLEAQDMDHIIKIHNANNESAWQEVKIIFGEKLIYYERKLLGNVMGVSAR